jgi:hypothetical protein
MREAFALTRTAVVAARQLKGVGELQLSSARNEPLAGLQSAREEPELPFRSGAT